MTLRRIAWALALTLVLAPSAHAKLSPQALRLHLGSWHDRGDFHNANVGVALRWKGGLTIGGFHNSLGRGSGYGGLVLPILDRRGIQLELMTGVITGYSETSPIDVVAVPILGWRMSERNALQVVFMPRLVIPANAVHVMFERRFGAGASEAPQSP